MTLDEFIEMVCQRPLPQNSMARIRTLAKELAEGASEEVWSSNIKDAFTPGKSIEDDFFRGNLSNRVPPDHNSHYLEGQNEHLIKYIRSRHHNYDLNALLTYIVQRWKTNFPPFDLLVTNNYISMDSDGFSISKFAFDLLDEIEPSTIFISYKRNESSTFALLVLARLKENGLEPFLDLALEPGEDWHAGLKERIQSRDYFVLLVGPTTLESEVVQKEITWALEGGLAIIPIWHGGFQYNTADWNLSPEIDQVLQNTHTIRVLEESALAYNNAIVELLNRFGITP